MKIQNIQLEKLNRSYFYQISLLNLGIREIPMLDKRSWNSRGLRGGWGKRSNNTPTKRGNDGIVQGAQLVFQQYFKKYIKIKIERHTFFLSLFVGLRWFSYRPVANLYATLKNRGVYRSKFVFKCCGPCQLYKRIVY